jgi:hypothetical protein
MQHVRNSADGYLALAFVVEQLEIEFPQIKVITLQHSWTPREGRDKPSFQTYLKVRELV